MRHRIDRTDALQTGISLSALATTQAEQGASRPAGSDRSSVASLIPGCRFFCGDDIRFTSLAESPQKAVEGQLVVYRIGEDCPSRLVAEAMARGAAGILTEQLLPCHLPQAIVGDVEIAVAQVTAEQCGHPDRKLLTVGVIGSAGKTSTTLLISTLLRGSGVRTAYQSDLGDSDGVLQSTSRQSLPGGADLVRWLDEACDVDCGAAIIELSDRQARQGQYEAIEFDLLIVTGTAISSDDYGPSGLDCALERLASDGVVITPADDANACRMVRESGAKMLTYGVRKAADVTAKIIDQSGGMTTLLVTHDHTTAVMETSLCGAAMAANHAAATVVGLLIAQPLEQIVERLGQLRSIPGRGQRLERWGHPSVIIDAGGSPERVADTLRTLRAVKSPGSLWCVLAIGSGDSATCLARYGTLLEKFADHIVVTSHRDHKASFLKSSHDVLDGVQKCAAFRLAADPDSAIRWALSEASPRDTIVAITLDSSASAVDARTEIDRLCKFVESTRDDADSDPIPSHPFKVVG